MTVARVITAPQPLANANRWPMVYLGGTIDMGDSEDWQAQAIELLSGERAAIVNPRRADWSADWLPVADEPHFREQVKWELEALEVADIVVLHFASGSKSPISLLELGLHARGGRLIVFCAPDYFRKGNIDITAERYGIERASSVEDLVERVRCRLARIAHP
ncbi:nucleoside 2-deoxyribosyltransferase domain-containing protein [uncultured Sphingomonas sp.]|uniref:nucleoside 2-deoxyribosyltransferase domain-containing protein n=1 Tax=uncultured Sphingomonas sp. TaxID=158754 RepID=UPI0025F14FBC|nr:nucleoside 2-deoxyribosyltransferase domain-containing protein [uncultured Sphingomonas sp.]